MRFADVESHTRRRLLNLFPDSALEPERPSLPGSDTAVDPPAPTRGPSALRPSEPRSASLANAYGVPEEAADTRRHVTADPRDPYRSASYERAKRDLLAAIRARRAFALLTAPAGMGKTTLCRGLARELDGQSVSSLIVDAPQSFDELLRNMLVAVGVIANDPAVVVDQPRPALLSALDTFLESLTQVHACAVVFIDGAQALSADVLLDLAALQAPGKPGARMLQLVLVGRPELNTLLAQADLRAVNAGIVFRAELGPLERGEISGYVARRLSLAGGRARIEFADTAAALLYERSAGVPHLVNVLSDRALRLAREEARPVVNEELVLAAVAALAAPPPRPRALTALLVAGAFALLVVAGGAGALWFWRDAVNRTILRWENVPNNPASPHRSLPAPLPPVRPPA